MSTPPDYQITYYSTTTQEFKDNHGGRAPNEFDQFDRIVSLILPGPVTGSRTWTDRDWVQYTTISPHRGLAAPTAQATDLDKAGITVVGALKQHLGLLTAGVSKFGEEIGKLISADGLVRLNTLTGGDVKLYLHQTGLCKFFDFNAGACTIGTSIEFYESFFTAKPLDPSHVMGTAVHELSHVINFLMLRSS